MAGLSQLSSFFQTSNPSFPVAVCNLLTFVFYFQFILCRITICSDSSVFFLSKSRDRYYLKKYFFFSYPLDFTNLSFFIYLFIKFGDVIILNFV
jgi:hypothetical protein